LRRKYDGKRQVANIEWRMNVNVNVNGGVFGARQRDQPEQADLGVGCGGSTTASGKSRMSNGE